MVRKIFIAATQQRSGKSLLTIGLIRALQGIIPHIGYMKPIGSRYAEGDTIDMDARLIRDIFDLEDDVEDINPASMSSVQGDKDGFFERVFSAYGRIESGKEIVIIGEEHSSEVTCCQRDGPSGRSARPSVFAC